MGDYEHHPTWEWSLILKNSKIFTAFISLKRGLSLPSFTLLKEQILKKFIKTVWNRLWLGPEFLKDMDLGNAWQI